MIKKLFQTVTAFFTESRALRNLQIEDFLQRNLYEHPKYQNPKKINKYEFKVFSQNGEDGIIEEIFERIGTTNKYFVEFGVGDGLECNSTYLLLKNWTGLWLEGNESFIKSINITFKDIISKGKLIAKRAFIDAENIESLFKEQHIPLEPDLISIDIDRNDYYVWNAIKLYRPRVVVIEYNATIRPNLNWRVKYYGDKVWDGTSHFNASLKAYEILGKEKGYKLVGCCFAGTNAFFVREDLVEEKFLQSGNSEEHYEPTRYYLTRQRDGHKRGFGEFEF